MKNRFLIKNIILLLGVCFLAGCNNAEEEEAVSANEPIEIVYIDFSEQNDQDSIFEDDSIYVENQQTVSDSVNDYVDKQEESVSLNFSNKTEEYIQFFDEYNEQEITIEDVSISYNGFVINSYTNYFELINYLGYPYDYEINNYGFISNENGYRWGLCYPSQNFVDYDIYIVCVSEDMIRESENTYIDFIYLNSVSTNRGINVGDTIEDVAEKYGKPTKIKEFSPNPDYNELVYENEYADLRFVFSRDDIVKYILIDINNNDN